MDDSVKDMEAPTKAFMEAMEVSIEACKLAWRQWKLLWKCGRFHGSFNAIMPWKRR